MSPNAKAKSTQAGRLRRALASAVAVGVASSLVVTFNPAPAQADEIGGWELDALNVHDAWDTTQGEGITIAVVDTGVGEHPFFDDKDVLPGYSFAEDETDGRLDENGHGTSVAASALSVAPDSTLLPVKYDIGESDVFGGDDQLPGRIADRDIVWAVDNGADVIALPWGRSIDHPNEQNALQYAVDNGVMVIAGTGNDPDEPVWWPAAYDGIVAVSGTDENDDLYVDSTTGEEVTVAAPAADITTAGVELGFDLEYIEEQAWGTSIATGLAAGVAALVLAADSDLDANNAIARMTDTAVDLGDSGWDPAFGHGLLDASAAINSTINDQGENPLGYPLGEPNVDVEIERYEGEEEPEDTSDSNSDDANTNDASRADEETLAGLPPFLFWTLSVATIVAIVAVTTFLLYRNKKANQQRTYFQSPPGPQPPVY